MENEKTAAGSGVNRAKTYQLVLFPLNNGATNVYYVLILSYIATFGNNVLGIATVFASVMVTGMRVFDAFTDPIIGALMDRTNGKLGKFRPFMLIGNIIMAFAVFMLYCICPDISEENMWLRYAAFIVLYAVWVIGYTFQTSVTRSGQTVLTNDPKQRPLFTIFNTIGSMAGMGLMQFMAPIIRSVVADYSSADFYRVLTPIGVVISFFLTILAIIGIWEKDNPKYFGIGGAKQEKTKASEYNQAVVEYSAQISERNKNIDDLQNQITDLQSKLSQYESTVGNTVDDAGASEQKLIEAVGSYLQNNVQDAGTLIAEIEPAAITNAQEKKIYKIYDISITYVFPSHVCMLYAGCGGFFLGAKQYGMCHVHYGGFDILLAGS